MWMAEGKKECFKVSECEGLSVFLGFCFFIFFVLGASVQKASHCVVWHETCTADK